MKTILVDDELWSFDQFEFECGKHPDIEIVGKFNCSIDALKFVNNNKVEFALLDIEMPGINGIELAKKFKSIYPDMIIVFVTGYEDHIVDAVKTRADFYIFKPYNNEDITAVIKRAKLLSSRMQKNIFIRTFGSFDVFVNGVPISFSSSKAKELLALIIDKKGGVLTNEEGYSYLWESAPYDHKSGSGFRKVVGRLNETLKNYGIDSIIKKVSNGRYANSNSFDCDYYLFLEGDENAKKQFNGEYMSNYSWGEYTLAKLWNMWK